MSMRAPAMKVSRAASNARTASGCAPSASRSDSQDGAASSADCGDGPSPVDAKVVDHGGELYSACADRGCATFSENDATFEE